VNEGDPGQLGGCRAKKKQTNIKISQAKPVNSATRNVQHTRKPDGVNNDLTSKGAPYITQIFRRVRGDAGLSVAVLTE